jgi:hypothetical protein
MATNVAPPSRPHVVAEEAGLSFVPHEAQRVFLDEDAGLLHLVLVEGRMVTSLALPGGAHGSSGGDAPLALAALPAAGTPGPPPLAPPRGHRRDASAASDASAGSGGSATARAFLVSEGPPPAAVRAAPGGGNFTALRRSEAQQVEFVDHETGNIFVEAPQ